MREAPGIEAYGGGGFRIGGVRFDGAVLILDDKARAWPLTSLEAMTPEALRPVFAAERNAVEFLVLGVGSAPRPAPRALREALATAGLGLEVMSTPEACRLYNLMAQGGRRVAAALLPV